MKLTPCLDCGVVGPWPNRHGKRCRPHARAYEQARAGDYRQLRLFRPDGPCVGCGATEDLTWDHVTPRSKGGGSEWANLQCLCRPCNSKKGGRG